MEGRAPGANSSIAEDEAELSVMVGRLGGHFKTGHTWSLQNRPTDRTQDMKLFYLAGASSRKRFSQSRREA